MNRIYAKGEWALLIRNWNENIREFLEERSKYFIEKEVSELQEALEKIGVKKDKIKRIFKAVKKTVPKSIKKAIPKSVRHIFSKRAKNRKRNELQRKLDMLMGSEKEVISDMFLFACKAAKDKLNEELVAAYLNKAQEYENIYLEFKCNIASRELSEIRVIYEKIINLRREMEGLINQIAN